MRSAARDVLDLLQTTRLPERLIELPEATVRGARAAAFSDARKAVRALALEELASRDRELLQELLTGFAAAYTEAKDRESALDFEDLQLRARKLLRENDVDPRGRAAPLPLDHGRRVPGHEQPPDRPRRPALRRPDEGAVLRRRRVPVDLRLPPRRRLGVPRPARGGAAGAAADAQLPLAAGGARCGQPAVRGRVRRELPGARRRRAATATRSSARRSSCSSPTRPRTPTPASSGAAPRRGTLPAACASSSTRARRRRARSSSSSQPEPTPSGSRRSCAPSTCRRSG